MKKHLTCTACKYEWDFEPIKRPDPRDTSCPNCKEMVILRENKLD